MSCLITISELMEQSGVGFGTSGARGLVEAMTDKVCYLYTVAFMQYLEEDRQVEPGGEVAVAGDLRPSSPCIVSAVLRAIKDQGYHGVYCGAIPSPAVALLGLKRGIPAIMVTGSHIPDDRNGIKFNKPAGEILKADEEGIRRQSVEIPSGLFDEQGGFTRPEELPEIDGVGRQLYVERFTAFFPRRPLEGCRVGVYEHSSVAREVMGEVLEALGAEVVRLGHSKIFIPVDTEAIRDEDIKLARQWVAEQHLDALVSTDGDGDRPLVSDERGEWLRGDIAGILAARFLQSQAVVTPVSSNSAVELCEWFSTVLRTRIGSPFVIEGMQGLLGQPNTTVVGYEANGGFLQASTVVREGRQLAPLPTRDALVVILAILISSREQALPVSALVAQLPPRYTHSDRIKAFPQALSQKMLGQLTSGNEQDDGQAFRRLFGEEVAEVEAIDYTDGVRLTLRGGEVVHLRPSGNAPELRCYTEADTPQRSVELNRYCLGVMETWKEGR